MEANSNLLPAIPPRRGNERAAVDSLHNLLDDLCECAAISLELAKDANEAEAQFADVTQNMARGLGYRLALAPSMNGSFIAIELQGETEDEWRRR